MLIANLGFQAERPEVVAGNAIDRIAIVAIDGASIVGAGDIIVDILDDVRPAFHADVPRMIAGEGG